MDDMSRRGQPDGTGLAVGSSEQDADLEEPPSHADLRVGRLMVAWWEAGTTVAVNLSGWDDLPEVAGELATLWGLLHDRAVARRATEVRVDVRALESVSSSCFKTLVEWLTGLAQDRRGHRYRVRFLSSRDLAWQHRSLAAVRALARDIVTIDLM